MRIGIDARKILSPEHGDAIGVGHYTYQLIRHLLDIDKENEYILFFDFRVREKDIKKFSRPNVKIKFFPFSDYKKYLPVAYNEILGTATLARENLDVLHSTSPSSRIPAGYRGKTVVTFHDLACYQHADVFSSLSIARKKAVSNLMANKVDKIIAVSQSTKDDVKKIFSCPEEKVKVIYSGIDKRFFEKSGVSREKALGKYGIQEKYILFLGTIESIKNIARLFEAFKIFKEGRKKANKGKCEYKLMLAGKSGWMAKEYKQMAKDLGIAKDVVFTGYIIGDEVVPLFEQAEFFILPSLYEGFGTTLLEAFATGTPAIVSRVSSLPEIADSAAYFVNPVDVQEIAGAMEKFATDENLRNAYRVKGSEQVKKFDWAKCAKETLDVYKSFAK